MPHVFESTFSRSMSHARPRLLSPHASDAPTYFYRTIILPLVFFTPITPTPLTHYHVCILPSFCLAPLPQQSH